jgi:ribonuclease J
MYQWLQPMVAVPVHGEAAHMQANAELARRAGIQRRLVVENGDLFRLAPMPSILRQAVPVGRLFDDKGRLRRV